jgi:hypothetical protein
VKTHLIAIMNVRVRRIFPERSEGKAAKNPSFERGRKWRLDVGKPTMADLRWFACREADPVDLDEGPGPLGPFLPRPPRALTGGTGNDPRVGGLAYMGGIVRLL